MNVHSTSEHTLKLRAVSADQNFTAKASPDSI
jgi:hypothetical protein